MSQKSEQENLAGADQVTKNAKHVLATCMAKHDPDECIYDHESDLLEDVLTDELPREAVAGIRAADPGIAKEMKEMRLYGQIIDALAHGVHFDTWWKDGKREAADRAEAKSRSPKLKAAIDNLAKEVAEILGPSPQAEAYARRWICCAIEENYWCF